MLVAILKNSPLFNVRPFSLRFRRSNRDLINRSGTAFINTVGPKARAFLRKVPGL